VFLHLTQVNKEVRKEFRNLYLNSNPARLPQKDVYPYLDRFYSGWSVEETEKSHHVGLIVITNDTGRIQAISVNLLMLFQFIGKAAGVQVSCEVPVQDEIVQVQLQARAAQRERWAKFPENVFEAVYLESSMTGKREFHVHFSKNLKASWVGNHGFVEFSGLRGVLEEFSLINSHPRIRSAHAYFPRSHYYLEETCLWCYA
jgi:hypothetical protein